MNPAAGMMACGRTRFAVAEAAAPLAGRAMLIKRLPQGTMSLSSMGP